MTYAAPEYEPKTAAPPRRSSLWRAVAVGGALAFLLFLLCTGSAPSPVIFLLELAIGWWGYLRRTVPNVRVNLMALTSAAACLIALVALGHGLARWLWRETSGGAGRRWRLRWTLASTAVVVLIFVAGIAAVGVTHQSAWLARSERPMFERSGRQANRVRCMSNLRQLGQAILMHAKDHDGRLPDTIEELAAAYDMTAYVYLCPATDMDVPPGSTQAEKYRHLDHNHVSYVYHGKGLKLPLERDTPIACEPLFNHDGKGMNILFADGRVEWHDVQDVPAVMERLGRGASR